MKSVWEDTKMPEFGSLKENIKTDVLIIGGGIAGILTACFLEQNGVDYVLVEKDRICSKNTLNTTAKITAQHRLIYSKILKSRGKEIAQKYLSANISAIKKYKELCKNIDCDFEIKDNFVYSQSYQKLEKEMRALEQVGYDADFCSTTSLPIITKGAVKFRNQAQFNPIKFLSKISEGLNIYENTFVREMTGNTARTQNGKIVAKRVISATHFPFINKHGGYFLKLYQDRSYVLALENAQKLDGMYVDEDDKGFSFRNYKDLLLLGGGANRTGHKCGSYKELRDFSRVHYPLAKEKYFFSAQDCMSLDRMPYIGRYSKNTENFYVITGFNKWGMTSAMVGAMLLTDMILGKDNEYIDVFDPSRSIVRPQLFVNIYESAKGLLTISKKRCPHLGCALKYNEIEHSFDCPCHGSRFDLDGKVLDNPSNGNLI